MKKVLAIMLIALMVTSTVFAAVTLSGEASTELAYKIDENWVGFTPNSKIKATFDATTGGSANEGAVYAEIKGSLKIKAVESPKEGALPIEIDEFKITDANIVGENWKVGILSAASTPTFAKGWEYNADEDSYTDSTAAVADEVPGVTVTVYDWTVGAGLSYDFDKDGSKNVMGTLKTPEFALAEGLTLQAGAGVAKTAGDGAVSFGGGTKVAYAAEALSATAAVDTVFFAPTVDGADFKWALDAALNVAVAPVKADVYYATSVKEATGGVDVYKDREYTAVTDTKNYLSAKVATDLNAFEVPVVITAAGLDLVNSQYMDLEVATTIDALSAKAFGGYQIGTKRFHIGTGASYDIENIGKVSANLTLAGTNDVDTLKVDAALENTTLVTGATLKAGYESGNLLADKAEVGKVYASATIKF